MSNAGWSKPTTQKRLIKSATNSRKWRSLWMRWRGDLVLTVTCWSQQRITWWSVIRDRLCVRALSSARETTRESHLLISIPSSSIESPHWAKIRLKYTTWGKINTQHIASTLKIAIHLVGSSGHNIEKACWPRGMRNQMSFNFGTLMNLNKIQNYQCLHKNHFTICRLARAIFVRWLGKLSNQKLMKLKTLTISMCSDLTKLLSVSSLVTNRITYLQCPI